MEILSGLREVVEDRGESREGGLLADPGRQEED